MILIGAYVLLAICLGVAFAVLVNSLQFALHLLALSAEVSVMRNQVQASRRKIVGYSCLGAGLLFLSAIIDISDLGSWLFDVLHLVFVFLVVRSLLRHGVGVTQAMLISLASLLSSRILYAYFVGPYEFEYGYESLWGLLTLPHLLTDSFWYFERFRASSPSFMTKVFGHGGAIAWFGFFKIYLAFLLDWAIVGWAIKRTLDSVKASARAAARSLV